MKTVKYGIIGVGNMGSGHLKLFMDGSVENAVVTAIADISELKRNKVKESDFGSGIIYKMNVICNDGNIIKDVKDINEIDVSKVNISADKLSFTEE